MLTSSSPGKPLAFVGGIVGGIVGSIAVVLLIFATTLFLRRCQRRRRRVVPYAANTQGDVLGEACADTLSMHRDNTSASSLLSPSPAPARDSYPLSEDFTAIAPYSDPKYAVPLAEKIASLSRSSAPVPARTPREVDQMAMDFTFVRASAPPPAHSVDVPDPALSVTGTERSVRHTELTGKIKALEEAVRELHYPGKSGAGASPRPESCGNTRERLHALKEEMARLRVELERERRLVMEAAPRNQRQGKRVLRSVE
ncbi:hypothetical protein BD413DRAFT_601546 [Trametes elegans]|nr:hypothetical protein BD413DRAFT_601546 [Trametes elegans]